MGTAHAEDTIRRESIVNPIKVPSRESSKRMASPPPPSHYSRGVSFDTFDNKGATTEGFTLRYKHRDYANSARSRTFLCGTDAKDYSEYALEWMIDEMVDDGDEIVCLRVIEKEDKASITTKYRQEAEKLLDSVIKKNSTEDKAISMIMELAIGKVQEVFQRMIGLYEPSALVVGTRGRNLGGMQGLIPGSVSKYCLQHSPVPVIVVRPTSKRLKKKMKRQQETGRSLYSSMVEQAQHVGGRHLRDKDVVQTSLANVATEQEADAVAKAIGTNKRGKGILKNYGGPLARVTSNTTDVTSDEDDVPAPGFSLPIGYLSTEAAPRADLAMKSPSIAMLEEDWDDTPTRSRSPAPAANGGKHERSGSDAFSEGDEDLLGPAKIVEHRRPSMRETTPWLADILRDKPPPRNRSGSRQRDSR